MMKNERRPCRRCRHGLKAAGKACVAAGTAVTIPLSEQLSWDVGYAAQVLLKLPSAIRQAVEAGEEAIAAFKDAEREARRRS